MRSPEEFREEYEGTLTDELPDRPITSLRDVQYLYGRLYTLATAGGGEYASYLTPDEARDLVDEPDSLIVVRVDLSEDEPQLADDDRGPVWVTRYTEDRVEKVAHCKYPAARGIDHSVTHQSGRNSDPEKLARYANERLTKWATDDVVQAVAANHDDGHIIDALARLGEDEAVRETIESAVMGNPGGNTTALLTVQVQLDGDVGYQWPGNLEVFNEAMRARKLSKLVAKGEAEDSAGEATDLVTGRRGRTVGTAQDPLNYYLGKQMEKFPGLDPDAAWRTHPISEDAAVTLMNSGTFVDACTYSTFGATVYYLPYYLGKVSPGQAFDLYQILYAAATDDDDDRMTPVERAYQALTKEGRLEEEGTRLRFYVSAVMKHQMSRYDVFGETMNGSIIYPVELARTHRDLLDTAAFTASTADWTAPLPTNEEWSLLADRSMQPMLRAISTGAYFYQTFAAGDDDNDAAADDPRIQALVAVLSGDAIPVERVLGAYVQRLIEDDGERFPSFLVASQFVQLCALADPELNLLRWDDPEKEPITQSPAYDTEPMPNEPMRADGGSSPQEKLESFIDDTPALRDNNQRRGAFLLGALVGAVGNYQEYHEDRSTTLVDQYPVKAVTRARVKKITQETVSKTLTYTRQEKKGGKHYPGTRFDWIVDELRATILDPEPDEWTLDTDDLRFYYALGVTYGMNDHPTATDDEPADEQLTDAA